jgi:hypothetical protein
LSLGNYQRKHCFVISPIGPKNSAVRKRSDKILKYIIRPVCEKLGFSAERADEIEKPGLISRNIILRLFNADLVIADLTGHNPNVFYELAIRHATGKPVVQLIEHKEKIPFDVFDFSTIQINLLDIESIENCKRELEMHIKNCSDGKVVLNPIIETIQTGKVELPFFRFEHSDITKQFQDLSDRLLKEIRTLRSEKSGLLDKIVGDADSSQKTSKAFEDPIAHDLSGVWESSLGVVKLSQNGTEIIGEYDYKDSVGNIRGRIIGDRVIFQWDWKDLEGVGYWRILGNQLRGLWFYLHQACSYTELLENPTRLDTLITPNMDQWLLWRNIRQGGQA